MRFIALLALFLAAAEAASIANKKTEFTCIAGRSDVRNASQIIRIECGADIDQGSSGIAEIDWSSILLSTTRLQDTRMLVDSVPETLREGEELISLHGTFTHDDKPVSTCQTKRKIVLEFNRSSEIEFTPKKYDPTDDIDEEDSKHKGKKDKKDKKEYDDKEYDEDKKDKKEKEYDSKDKKEKDDKEYNSKDSKAYEEDKKDKKEKEYDSKDSKKYDEDKHKDKKEEKETEYDSKDDKKEDKQYKEKEYDSKDSKKKHKKEKKDKYHKADGYLMSTVYDEWDSMDAELLEEDAEMASWGKHTKQCNKHGDDKDYGDDKDKEYPQKDTKKDYNEEDSGKTSGKASLSAATPQNKNVRPNGMRVMVKCKSAEDLEDGETSEGTCSVRLRLILSMTGGINQFPGGNPSAAMDALVTDEQYTCRVLTFLDMMNVLATAELNGGDGPAVDTQLCFPSAAPAAGAPTIPAGAPWDEVSLDRAVRFSRYASTLHGCLPGQEYGAGQVRTWDDVATWGGPVLGAECPSCFKDGINYGPGFGGPPFGRQTADEAFNIVSASSFEDAAVVTTDFDLDPASPAIVVAFRATVTALNAMQWVSNLGSCALLARFLTEPIRDSAGTVSPAAGTVCEGWARQVDFMYADLLADVRQRIAALSGPGGRTTSRIFITGHSRGGALATYFAARLLLEQDAGNLGIYTGPFSRRGQISLYTFGAPRVGDATFAGFLEQRMYERFRVINRFDPVTSAPGEFQGYQHVRPAVWFREADAFAGIEPVTAASLRFQYCVLTPSAQLSVAQELCFDSCNSAVVCTNVDVPSPVAIAGTRVPANAACERISDATVEGTARQIFRAPLGFIQDHSTYMGINVDNGACAEDQSVLTLGQDSILPWCAAV